MMNGGQMLHFPFQSQHSAPGVVMVDNIADIQPKKRHSRIESSS